MRTAFWKVILPLLLVAACLGLGTLGFLRSELIMDGKLVTLDGSEAFWLATGLPALETTNYPEPGSRISPVLNVARGLGLLIPPYAFVLIVTSLIGDRLKLAKVWWWQHVSRRPFVLVLGTGWIGNEIVQDLVSPPTDGPRQEPPSNVVAVDLETAASDLGVRHRRLVFVKGDATSRDILARLGAGRANKVYVVCNSDETNFWIVDQLRSLRPIPATNADIPACYAHVLDSRKRFHLSRICQSEPRLNVSCFNVYETTARRLYFEMPNYCSGREAPADDNSRQSLRIIVMGYTPMGKAMVLQCLRAGHFRTGQSQEIVVVAEDAGPAQRDFLGEYPCFAPHTFSANTDLRNVCAYAFPGVDGRPAVQFIDLPRADSQLLGSDFVISRRLEKSCITGVYVCLDDGLRSAAYFTIMAEKTQHLLAEQAPEERPAYAMYLYYNIPREQQAARIKALSDLFTTEYPQVRTGIFGLLMEHCPIEVVEAREIDSLAKHIAAAYAGAVDPEAHWKQLKEGFRESNRQAADHIAVKLRCLGVEIGPYADMVLSVDTIQRRVAAHMEELAEMEHRRWCAEKLLDGWLPLPQTRDNVARWEGTSAGDEEFRQSKKVQKLHRDLVPYAQLSDRSKQVNRDQVLRIADYIDALRGA
jgi:voltage-gated potassium channel Kch